MAQIFDNRFARERLRAPARSQGSIQKDVPEVLFVCVHNAGRSQMAAGLLSKRAEGRVHVRSAGSTPANRLNPRVVEAMTPVEREALLHGLPALIRAVRGHPGESL